MSLCGSMLVLPLKPCRSPLWSYGQLWSTQALCDCMPRTRTTRASTLSWSPEQIWQEFHVQRRKQVVFAHCSTHGARAWAVLKELFLATACHSFLQCWHLGRMPESTVLSREARTCIEAVLGGLFMFWSFKYGQGALALRARTGEAFSNHI